MCWKATLACNINRLITRVDFTTGRAVGNGGAPGHELLICTYLVKYEENVV